MLFQVNAIQLGIQDISVELKATFCTSMHQDSFREHHDYSKVPLRNCSAINIDFCYPQVLS